MYPVNKPLKEFIEVFKLAPVLFKLVVNEFIDDWKYPLLPEIKIVLRPLL